MDRARAGIERQDVILETRLRDRAQRLHHTLDATGHRRIELPDVKNPQHDTAMPTPRCSPMRA